MLAVIVTLASNAAGAQRVTSPTPMQSDVGVVRLETDAAANPLGIDERAPRLSWRIESRRRGVQQSSYRVLVATRPELLREGRADAWDSGEIDSAQPWTIYKGKALASRSRYFWSVRARTTAGASGWSIVAERMYA